MNKKDFAEVIQKTQKLLQDRGRNKKLSTEQMTTLMSAFSSSEESSPIVFKANDKVLKDCGEVRVECDVFEDQSISVVLTTEGIIIDCIEGGEIIATSSMTYSEKFDQMRGL